MKKVYQFSISVVLLVFLSAHSPAQTLLSNIDNAHDGDILSLAIHPNGKQFLTTGSDGRTNLWNLETYKKVKAFVGHTGKINAVAYSADGKFFVTGGSDKTLILWDSELHKPLKIMRGHTDEVTCVAFNPLNNEVASGSADKSVIIWDANGKSKFTLSGQAKRISAVAFSPDGKSLATATATDEVVIFNALNGSVLKKVNADDKKPAIIHLAYSDDGRYLVFSTDDKSVRSIDVAAYKPTARTDIKNLASAIDISPDGKYIIATCKDGPAVLWDFKNVTALQTVAACSACEFSNRGDKLVTATGNKIAVWDVKYLGIRGREMPFALEGFAQGSTRGVGITPLSLEEITMGKYYALIIGIDNYNGAWPKLSNAVNDAKAVEQTLKTSYRFDHFVTLYDEEATRENITKKLEWMTENVQPEDNVLIYYSGHGDFKQQLNKGYWVPVDAQTKSISDYISNSVIQDFLNGIASKHTLLIADACFSGDIFRGSIESVPFENSEKYYKRVYQLKSRQAISSGGVEPVMDGGRDGHSVFAYYLLKALGNNEDRYLDAGQLYSRVNVPIVNNSNQSPIFSPVKDTVDEGGQFIFIKK